MSQLVLFFSKNAPTLPSFTYLSECCSTLSSRQHKAFLAYLAIPYFNTDQLLIILYERIINAKRRGSKSIKADKILEKWEVATNKKWTEKSLKKKVKELYQLVQRFLVDDHLRNNPNAFLEILQKELHNKGASHAFQQVVEERRERMAEQQPGLEKLLATFLINHQTYFEVGTNYEKKGQALVNELQQQLKELSKLLNGVYKIEIASSEKVVNNQAYPSTKTKSTTQHLLPLFEQAHQLLRLENFSQKKLDQFIANFLTAEPTLARMEKLLLCKTIINVLSVFNTSVQHPLDHQLYLWIRRSVEWSRQPIDYVSPNNYLNAVIASCGCGDFDFADNYIAQHGSMVEAKARYLGEAYYYFRQEKFARAIEILRTHFVPSENYNLLYTLRAHLLLYRAYLAQDICHDISGDENFFDLEDRCRRFLGRKEANLNPLKHSAYTNFFLLAKQLLQVYESQNQLTTTRSDYLKRVEKLKKEIVSTTPLHLGSWLYKLVKELK